MPFPRILILSFVAALAAACSEPPPAISDPPIAVRHYRALGEFTMPVWQVAFSPDGKRLAAAGADGTLTIWRWPEAMIEKSLTHSGGATGIAFSPDGKSLASVGYDRKLRLWDVEAGSVGRALEGHEGTVWAVAFSPDGGLIATGGEDKTVRLWNVAEGRLLRTIAAHDLNVWAVRFMPDGRRVVSGSFDTTANIWNVETGALERTLRGHTEAIVEVAASADGAWIATAGDDSSVRLWKNQGVRAEPDPLVLSAGQHVYAVAFSPDSKYVASGGREKGALGTLIKHFLGRVGMSRDPTVRIWRVADGAMIEALSHPGDDVHSVAFSPDGQWLAASGADKAVHVWRITSR